jgi:L-2-hydroxyglutarate oxidase LhgO
VLTSAGELRPRFVLNCAGLHADRVARDFGFSRDHVILPFKGLYLYSSEAPGALGTHVYPVPDLKFPFLGVHFTVTADGHVKIGPTALPALWREQYGGLSGFSLRDLVGTAARNLGLFFKAGFDYRALAKEELAKCSRTGLVRRASALIEGVREEDYREWGRPGIRAQLMDVRTRALVGDFLLEGDASSLHVLNAVSPAWTCSIPFARHVADRIAALGGPGK